MCSVAGCPGGPDLGGRSHGRGTARYGWFLRGEGLAVEWYWFADEHHPETVEHLNETIGMDWRQGLWPSSGGISYHTPIPVHAGQESHEACRLVGMRCYFNCSFTAADAPMDAYKQDGPEAAWEWLEGYWHRQMAAVTGSRVA